MQVMNIIAERYTCESYEGIDVYPLSYVPIMKLRLQPAADYCSLALV